jgi:hypothetical protein
MFSKISIFGIIKDHIGTLRDNRTNKIYIPDIILFFVIPGIISSVMIQFEIRLNDGFVNALITSFSIFSALLFNLLLLVYSISDKPENNYNNSDALERDKVVRRRILLREIYINISFLILISTIAVVSLLTYFLKSSNCNIWAIDICSLKWLLALIVYYLAAQFILTLLMVLKRIYRLLSRAFETTVHEFRDDNK